MKKYSILMCFLLTLSTACMSSKSPGDIMLDESTHSKELGKQWSKGSHLTSKGHHLQKEGEDLIKKAEKMRLKGEHKIKAGWDMICKGEKLERESENTFQQEHPGVLK